ncbi:MULTISPECIES: phage tail sheath family protein [unclassified Micromonospora]|uniref:phage tail sheath family protein n=1 Tax=unclassified Micromonospora TaxID=2617518 RepID=UPI002FF0F49F
MLMPTYPGVYTKEQPSGARSVAGAATSIALFVGPTRSGIDNRPIRCLNYGDFERNFGGLYAKSSLSYSVLHFFANGGGQAFVLRLPAKNAKPAESALLRDATGSEKSITLTALSSGAASSLIFVEVDPFDIGANPFSTNHDKKRFNLTIIDALTGRAERFSNLTTAAGNTRTADAVVNDPTTGSKLVKLTLDGTDADGPQATGSIYKILKPTGGTFGEDVKLRMSVTRRDANGADDSTNSITDLAVTVFDKDTIKPTTPLELVTRLVAALNKAIRDDPGQAAKLGGAVVEGAVFEGGTLMRLKLTPPAGVVGSQRIHDATVTIKDPSSGKSFSKEYIGTATPPETLANPSRYQLGQKYGSSQITAPQNGLDGDAHGQPDSVAFEKAIARLEKSDPFFNLLCLPDLVRPSAAKPTDPHHENVATVYAEANRVCAKKFAFLLVDPPPDTVDVGSAEAWKTTKFLFSSSHAGAWFPNVRVDDPLVPGAIMSHPPSGAIAGVIARTDSQVGVWQAPAGTDATLVGVYGPAVELSDEEHGLLNPISLNVIRRFPIYQTVAFGSRTVEGANVLGSQWKYIPVRRTANHILRSLSESLRWAVHKPNGEDLWSQLRVSCTAFMHGLFRQGAFKGTSAREAYFVACDASTTSPGDIEQGIVNIVVGFAPLKPAEFVVITLRQIVQPTA